CSFWRNGLTAAALTPRRPLASLLHPHRHQRTTTITPNHRWKRSHPAVLDVPMRTFLFNRGNQTGGTDILVCVSKYEYTDKNVPPIIWPTCKISTRNQDRSWQPRRRQSSASATRF